jgi:hypothetical protein
MAAGQGRSKRPSFTRRELDLIQAMAIIAESGMIGEGDYADGIWNAPDIEALLESVCLKASDQKRTT